jgi:hypothetical protein
VTATEPPLVAEVLPDLARHLTDELNARGLEDLAAQVPSLRVLEPCGCDDDFCQSFGTARVPRKESVLLWETVGLGLSPWIVNVDVADGLIVHVEWIL